MSCSNCFNGCTEITSDKCVRYTGANIPELGIQNGDTLLFVEQALAQYLISALNGTEIRPVIDPSIICNAVSVNLPSSGNLTLIDIISGLVKSICDLQEEIDTIIVDVEEINDVLAILNSFYDIPSDCFEGVTINPESTHSVLQATLDRLCSLVVSLPTTYVLQSELNSSVTAILENEGLVGPVTKEYTKMVPYVAYPWFAPDSVVQDNFGSTGAGSPTGPYQYVNFCNGQNGTPDMRGRVPAGVTTGMLGGAFDPEVNPNTSGNPNYSADPFTKFGTNFVQLSLPQMPNHFHGGSNVRATDRGHTHTFESGTLNIAQTAPFPDSRFRVEGGNSNDIQLGYTANIPDGFAIIDTITEIIPEGDNLPHNNTQPTIGCYYIMYIPA
jgi:microcystin-dependent protein